MHNVTSRQVTFWTAVKHGLDIGELKEAYSEYGWIVVEPGDTDCRISIDVFGDEEVDAAVTIQMTTCPECRNKVGMAFVDDENSVDRECQHCPHCDADLVVTEWENQLQWKRFVREISSPRAEPKRTFTRSTSVAQEEAFKLHSQSHKCQVEPDGEILWA